MGNVLATWQGIEHVVTDIYLIFFKPSRVDPAAVAYHAVRTFDMRLGAVAALIKFYCSDEQNQDWRGLLREI